eukprot:1159262-Pelagomonas_calceolata.AAC.3
MRAVRGVGCMVSVCACGAGWCELPAVCWAGLGALGCEAVVRFVRGEDLTGTDSVAVWAGTAAFCGPDGLARLVAGVASCPFLAAADVAFPFDDSPCACLAAARVLPVLEGDPTRRAIKALPPLAPSPACWLALRVPVDAGGVRARAVLRA